MAGWPSVLVAIGVALAVIVVNEESMYNRRRSRSGNAGKHNHQTKCDIFIGILSARDHFEHRKAIRETWLGYIHTHPKWKKRICSKFVVGNHSCHLPPEYRRDPYSCTPLNISKTGKPKDIVAMTVANDTGIFRLTSGPIGFDFKVHYPIILHKLGVFDSSADGIKHPLTVSLFDTWRQVRIYVLYSRYGEDNSDFPEKVGGEGCELGEEGRDGRSSGVRLPLLDYAMLVVIQMRGLGRGAEDSALDSSQVKDDRFHRRPATSAKEATKYSRYGDKSNSDLSREG
eukprot:XP_011670022.1 PREDICTED: uncharacterized protein LOC100892841 [Strongylocentrotus purpuratus]